MGRDRAWLAAWAAFGLFTIAGRRNGRVACGSARPSHAACRDGSLFRARAASADELPVRTHTGRLLKVMLEGSTAMFGVWLSFFREHFAALVALVVLLPATLVVNWRLGAILVVLVIVLGARDEHVVRPARRHDAERGGSGQQRFGRAGGGRPRQRAGDPELSRAEEETSALSELIDRMLNAQLPVLTWWAVVLGRDPIEFDDRALRDSGHRRLARHARADQRRPDRRLHEPGDDAGRTPGADGHVRQLHVGPIGETEALLRGDGYVRPSVTDAPDAVDVGRARGLGPVRGCFLPLRRRARSAALGQFRRAGGRTIALVGATGSGKSTTLNLLHRVFDPPRDG